MPMSLTTESGLSRFLLEMALDQEALRARVATRLVLFRKSQRPPLKQQEMAASIIDENDVPISYRQYQRWENELSTPEWRWL